MNRWRALLAATLVVGTGCSGTVGIGLHAAAQDTDAVALLLAVDGGFGRALDDDWAAVGVVSTEAGPSCCEPTRAEVDGQLGVRIARLGDRPFGFRADVDVGSVLRPVVEQSPGTAWVTAGGALALLILRDRKTPSPPREKFDPLLPRPKYRQTAWAFEVFARHGWGDVNTLFWGGGPSFELYWLHP